MVGHYPDTLQEALRKIKEYPEATIYAGGTDLMVAKKFAHHIIFINHIPELKEIAKRDAYLYLGVCNTFSDLINMQQIPHIMKKVFSNVASPAIRNMGTIGGNLCNASPVGDSLPMWYGMNAEIELTGLDEKAREYKRQIPISQFIRGIRKIDRRPGELVTGILIPEKALRKETFFYAEKVGARRSEAISKISIFGLAQIDAHRLTRVDVAFGAVGITVIYKPELLEPMKGTTKEEFHKLKSEIAEKYMIFIKPIDDQRSSSLYRKQVAGNLLKDFFDQIENRL